MTVVLECADLRHVYRVGDHEVHALAGADVHAAAGRVTALVGPSGSGKSTLLFSAGLLMRPTSGEVVIEGVATSRLGERERAQLRGRSIGYLFQQPRLVAHLTVLENVVMPLLATSRRASIARGRELLDRVGLAELENRMPGTLSGGQAHRAALCRALVRSPRIVLADEPTASLDDVAGDGIRELLRSTAADGVAVVVSTHDARTIAWADVVVPITSGSTTAPPSADAQGTDARAEVVR